MATVPIFSLNAPQVFFLAQWVESQVEVGRFDVRHVSQHGFRSVE